MAPALKLITPPAIAESRAGGGSAHRSEDRSELAWSHAQLSGRLCELSTPRAGAQLTFAFSLVLDAQKQGETAAWIGLRSSAFFPPDVEACGVDLDALAVVRLEEAQQLGRAADHLLRSGAFGLLLLDLGSAQLSPALLSRLAGLAQKHAAAVLFLTEKSSESTSLSSLVSLRAEVSPIRREPRAPGRFLSELHAIKDKRRAPGWKHFEEHRGPAGLR